MLDVCMRVIRTCVDEESFIVSHCDDGLHPDGKEMQGIGLLMSVCRRVMNHLLL